MKTPCSSSRSVTWLAVTGLALASAVTARADYNSTVLADGPTAFYALNPVVDGTSSAPDLTGNGNNGVAVNVAAANGPSPYITNAASFNNAAIDLSQGNNPGILNFSGPITLEAWAQPANSTFFGDVVAKGYDSSSYQEIVMRVNGPYGANYYASSGSQGVSGGTQSTNWTYVVLSSDGTHTTLYVNGVQVQQVSDTSGAQTFSDDWVIGDGSSAGNGRFFNGNISEVAIYNYGLSAAQVQSHYYAGLLGPNPSASAPVITAQPQPQQSFVGGTATFSVSTVSAITTTNQWYKNGVPISGQTGATLALANLQLSSTGAYSVVVGNINGSVTSSAATLAVTTPNNLKWTATGSSGTWDTGSTTDWINLTNSVQTVFSPGDAVLFDDTAGVATTVNVSGTVLPSTVTVNSSANAFSIGSGTIAGSGKLIKSGSSALTVTCSGGFTGTVQINGGSVYAGNNCFSAVSGITVTNNSTLDLGGGTFNNNKPVTVSGTGVNGEGSIFNSYADYPGESMNITLADDTKFGGSARWDLASGSFIGGPHNLTVDWSAGAGYGQWNSVTFGANLAGINVVNGSSLGMTGNDSAAQNPAMVLTVSTNSTLAFYSGGYNGSLHVLNNGTVYLWGAPAAFNGSNVILENGAQWQSFYNTGDDEPVNDTLTLNGVAHIVVGDHNMIYTNIIEGTGGYVMDYYNHGMILSASNTYSGPTVIGNGPEVVLTDEGSISHSSLIFFGGSSAAQIHLDATGRNDGMFTLNAGQTLGGIGTIAGDFTASAGSVLEPGGTNTTIGITTGSSPVGAITALGDVALDGNTILKLDGTSNDVVQCTGDITCGGTLTLANISGTPYTPGETFQIFNSSGVSGSFGNIVPATPGPGMAWDLSQLASGTIGIGSVPFISGVTSVNGGLVLSGTGGPANGGYYVLATTNLATPLGNWVPVSTNSFDSSGNFTVTNAMSQGVRQQFYLIEQVPAQ